MIRQISIFAENTKGAMEKITGVPGDAGINIEALITNDSGEFGVVRMLTDDPERAKECFEKAGYLCHLDYVFAACISDDPGSLRKLLTAIEEAGINVDYVYMSYDRKSASPIAVFHAEDAEGIEEALTWKGYKLL